MISVSVKKWGNSPAIRIPAAVMQALALTDESELELEIRGNEIALKPKKTNKIEFKLDDLLAKITPDNKHDLLEWGEPVGKEIW
ncbi:AbrB/MazE/SpoVT family DNA-binding domain-containing protein [Salmonella enterica]|nr:AbrB/MazE/SpoVT family DNA-binding domain-containing protein [Salmonella enterica]